MTQPEAPRSDIQALRALAVLLVVIFHIWPGLLPGGYVGVDVFLVISGFLITKHLIDKPPTYPGGLRDFWARRVRRLLPAATAALVGTAVLALVFLPATDYAALARATAASAFAVENWNLIALSSDYLAADDDPSPVQHYWSLGVEEQFYLVWPVLIALCLAPLIARRTSRAVGFAVVAIGVVSFAASVLLTGRGGALAYFATATRVWELGVGAALAVWSSQVVGRGPAPLRRALWWGGAIAILVSAVFYGDVGEFPGYRAALPVLGAAAMIAASGDGLRLSGQRVYGAVPVQWIGDRSYSIYLWHWPLIVAVGAVLPRGWALTGVVIIGTGVLAAASKRWLEDVPRRSSRLVTSRRATAGLLVTCTLVSLAAAGTVWLVQDRERQQGEQLLADASDDACLGVGSIRDVDCEPSQVSTTPVQASHDKPAVYADDCWNSRPFTGRTVCHYGAPKSDVRVALYGNSHAGQWQPPLAAAATRRGWSLDTYLASECYSVDIPLDFDSATLSRNCLELQRWGAEAIIEGDYDVVVMSNRSHQPLLDVAEASQFNEQVASYSRVIERFLDAGVSVLVMRDTPYPAQDIPRCLASKVTRDCSTPRERALPADPLAEAADAFVAEGAAILDASDVLCGEATCEPIIGGLIVNFDQGHFARAFALTLTPEVAEALDRAVASG